MILAKISLELYCHAVNNVLNIRLNNLEVISRNALFLQVHFYNKDIALKPPSELYSLLHSNYKKQNISDASQS